MAANSWIECTAAALPHCGHTAATWGSVTGPLCATSGRAGKMYLLVTTLLLINDRLTADARSGQFDQQGGEATGFARSNGSAVIFYLEPGSGS
ncbi:MAG TPA: hypothetical protein VHY31_18595 [Streptosporangiaceae bacterium]|jgi:hypothetical protein|nr:hypothetical protein [Streptosporangiaceae bacterium]